MYLCKQCSDRRTCKQLTLFQPSDQNAMEIWLMPYAHQSKTIYSRDYAQVLRSGTRNSCAIIDSWVPTSPSSPQPRKMRTKHVPPFRASRARPAQSIQQHQPHRDIIKLACTLQNTPNPIAFTPATDKYLEVYQRPPRVSREYVSVRMLIYLSRVVPLIFPRKAV